MAVAFSSANIYQSGNSDQLSFSVTNAGNAFCLIVTYAWFNIPGYDPGITMTCNGATLTSTFTQSNTENDFLTYNGYSKVNSSGVNNIVITAGDFVDYISATVICLSGAGSLTSSNAVAPSVPCDDAFHTYSLSVTSQVNDLIISFAGINGVYSSVNGMSGTSASTPFWYSQTAGASPSVSVTGTYYGDSADSTAGYFLAGFSFAPGSTLHAYLGYSEVANQIQTTPGNASGVVGNANNGLGNAVAGGGVVDVYSGVS